MAPGFTLKSQQAPPGRLRLQLDGSLTLADGGVLWRELSAALSAHP